MSNHDRNTRFTTAMYEGIQIPEHLDHNRPLMEQSIMWMINNIDKHTHLIKQRDGETLFFCAEVCRELMYLATGLEPMDFMSPWNVDKLKQPDQKVMEEIARLGLKVDIIDNEDQVGWRIVHPPSGYLATLTYKLR